MSVDTIFSRKIFDVGTGFLSEPTDNFGDSVHLILSDLSEPQLGCHVTTTFLTQNPTIVPLAP